MIKPLRNHSLTERVRDSLEMLITQAQLEPGQRLVETELSKEFAISRGPLREAFRLLEQDGLVINIPRKGTFVAPLTTKEIKDIYNIRSALESLSVRLTIPTLHEKELQKLKHLIKQMKTAIKSGEQKAYWKLNVNFHEFFVFGNDNEKLQGIYMTFSKQLARFHKIVLNRGTYWHQSFKDHQKIAQAVMTNNPDSAENLMKEHLENAREALLESISEVTKYQNGEKVF